MNLTKHGLALATGLVLSLVALTVLVTGPLQADDNEEALVQRIKEAVIEELRESGVLDREVDRGIKRFVERERAARRAAEQQQAQKADLLAKNVRPVSKQRDHILGNPDAEVSIIEYSDFECPFCKQFHKTAHRLVKAFDGRVNWVYRHFPLGFHNPAAQKEGEASECAAELGGNEAFWGFTDKVYELTPSNGKGLSPAEMAAIVKSVGVDQDAFIECYESGRHAARVQEDFREGSLIGISGTPGNILRNNKTGDVMVRSGARPFEALQPDIDFLLN